MTEADQNLPDAYQQPQQVRPGYQHQLGCRCVPPYWLRASTPTEEAREAWLRGGMGKNATTSGEPHGS